MPSEPNVIRAGDGYVYTLTPSDLLLASRMIVGESGTNEADAVAVLFTMASRLAELHGTSFADMISLYSQPINSAHWGPSGDRCQPGGSGYGTDACSAAALQRRAQIMGMQPSDMPRQWAIVQRWASGGYENPVPRATEFAAPRVVATCLLGQHGDCRSLVKIISNAFTTSQQSDSWPANFVAVGGAGDAPSSMLPMLALGAGVAVAAGVVTWVVSREYAA